MATQYLNHATIKYTDGGWSVMNLYSICPVCDDRAIPYSHKLAAADDILIPAQCQNCGKHFAVSLSSTARLGRPEVMFAPIGIIVWCITQNLQLAAQLGLLGSVVVFGLTAQFASFIQFSPDDGRELNMRRNQLFRGNLFVLTLLFALTLLIP